MPQVFCKILLRVLRDFVDGTSSMLLTRNSHKNRSSCLRENTKRGRCMRMSKEHVYGCISGRTEQSSPINLQFYPPTETTPRTDQYLTDWCGHVCEDPDQHFLLYFLVRSGNRGRKKDIPAPSSESEKSSGSKSLISSFRNCSVA